MYVWRNGILDFGNGVTDEIQAQYYTAEGITRDKTQNDHRMGLKVYTLTHTLSATGKKVFTDDENKSGQLAAPGLTQFLDDDIWTVGQCGSTKIFLKYSFEHSGTSMHKFEPVDPLQAAYAARYQPNRLCMTLLLQEAEDQDLC